MITELLLLKTVQKHAQNNDYGPSVYLIIKMALTYKVSAMGARRIWNGGGGAIHWCRQH